MNQAIIGDSNKPGPGFLPIDAVGNSFVVKEWEGSGPDYLHVHYEDDEAWHILEGSLIFKFADGEKQEYYAGTTVFVPAGVPHTYVDPKGSTRYLIILTPRLNMLIEELHKTPAKNHDAVLKKYKSEIIHG